jgi:hypothetical protein
LPECKIAILAAAAPHETGEDFLLPFRRRVIGNYRPPSSATVFESTSSKWWRGIGAASTIGKLFPNRRSRVADFIDDLL